MDNLMAQGHFFGDPIYTSQQYSYQNISFEFATILAFTTR